MSDKKRTGLLLGLLVVIALANIVVRMGDDDFDGGMWNADGIDTDIPNKLQQTVAQLADAPKLTFREEKQPLADRDENARNPFIFGIDKRLEQQRQSEMAALAEQRQAMEAMEQATVAAQPSEPPQAEFPGRILGVMESRRDGRTLSVVIDQEVKIFRTGDTINGAFRLESIGYQTVRLIRLEDGSVLDLNLETN